MIIHTVAESKAEVIDTALRFLLSSDPKPSVWDLSSQLHMVLVQFVSESNFLKTLSATINMPSDSFSIFLYFFILWMRRSCGYLKLLICSFSEQCASLFFHQDSFFYAFVTFLNSFRISTEQMRHFLAVWMSCSFISLSFCTDMYDCVALVKLFILLSACSRLSCTHCTILTKPIG